MVRIIRLAMNISRMFLLMALLGLSAAAASASDELLRVWSAPGVPARERAAAVNRCFTNGTPISLIVSNLGTNYTRLTPFSMAGRRGPLTSELMYKFGRESVCIGTTASPDAPLLSSRFTGAGYTVPAPTGQPGGAANRSQPVGSETNRSSPAAGSGG